MNITAAQEFIKWFGDNSARLAAIHDKMVNSVGSDGGGSHRAMKVFAKLEKEISPRLIEVQEGLIFEVGPSKLKKHALILSAGGVIELIPAVQYLSNELKSISEWEVIPFKPARTLDSSSRQVVMTSQGEKTVTPSDVFISLHPELTKVGVRLYFNDYQEDDYRTWGQVGFNYLDFSLGEYVVMESVGEIGFYSSGEAPQDAFIVTELPTRFQTAVAIVRSGYTQLSQMNQTHRLEHILSLNLKAIENIDSVTTEDSSDEELNLNLIFWAEDKEAEASMVKAFRGFEVSSEPKLASVGKGFEITLSGTTERGDFDSKNWLAQRLTQVKEFVVLIGIHQPAPINPMMAQFAAAGLIENDQFEEAIKILKSALRGVGDQDDGQLHGLLGIALLKADKYVEAAKIYSKALELAQDVEIRGEILTNKGSALQKMGNLDAALECFELALELDQEKFTRQYNVGQAYAQKGQVEKACDHLGKALKSNSEIKDHMLSDKDLESIRDTEEFKAMISQYGKKGFLGGIFKKGKKS